MKKVIVIGGGVAGLQAATTLRTLGFEPQIIEKEAADGGHLARWDRLFPNQQHASELLATLRSAATGITRWRGHNITRVSTTAGGVRVSSDAGAHFEGDAAVIATGFDLFDARLKEEYGYGTYENVITSADLERMFASADGVRCANGQRPRKVAILHCVGSRDEKVGQNHCSRLCCITGVKQAIELREALPECSVTNFYMDLRTFGNGYEEMYRSSQVDHGVTYVRGRISEAGETIGGQITLKVEDTLVGRPLRLSVDMLVLLVGMSAPACCASFELGQQPSGFVAPLNPFEGDVRSSRDERIFLAGTVTGPKSIGESIAHAKAAALAVADYFDKPATQAKSPDKTLSNH